MRGDQSRLRRVARRLLQGEPIGVFTAGGSVTVGMGANLATEGWPFPTRIFDYMNRTFPPTAGRGHRTTNGGVSAMNRFVSGARGGQPRAQQRAGGTGGLGCPAALIICACCPPPPNTHLRSAMYEMCASELLDPDADLYILEFSVNDHTQQEACNDSPHREWGGRPGGGKQGGLASRPPRPCPLPLRTSSSTFSLTSSLTPHPQNHVRPQTCSADMWDYPQRRAFERLVRRTLAFKQQPAVLVLHHYSYHHSQGAYFAGAENDLSVVAEYYQVRVRARVGGEWSGGQGEGGGRRAAVRLPCACTHTGSRAPGTRTFPAARLLCQTVCRCRRCRCGRPPGLSWPLMRPGLEQTSLCVALTPRSKQKTNFARSEYS